MKQVSKKQCYKEFGGNRPQGEALWKRIAVATLAAVLVLGLMGCTVDDVLSPFGVGDIPFEEEQTTPPDMGAVDDRPTVPNDEDFDDIDFRPL